MRGPGRFPVVGQEPGAGRRVDPGRRERAVRGGSARIERERPFVLHVQSDHSPGFPHGHAHRAASVPVGVVEQDVQGLIAGPAGNAEPGGSGFRCASRRRPSWAGGPCHRRSANSKGVDVVASFPSDAQAAEPVEPGGPFDHPEMDADAGSVRDTAARERFPGTAR